MAVLPNSDGENFVQRNRILNLEGPVNDLVRGAYEFSDNLADILNDVSTFLSIAAFFLRSIKSPLELVLLPVIDSLQSYLEELKNIGAGILTIYPWELGTNPQPINFDRLLESLKRFEDYYIQNISSDTEENNDTNDDVSPDENITVSEISTVSDANPPNVGPINASAFDVTLFTETPYENSNFRYGVSQLIDSTSRLTGTATQTNPEIRDNLLSSFQAIRNFLDLDSSTWQDSAYKDILEKISTFLNKRELTPEQAIQYIIDSFDDTNDPNRPTGSGEYSSFIILATLPSLSGINRLVNSIAGFFSGILDLIPTDEGTEADTNEKTTDINLGYPVVLRNPANEVGDIFYNDVKIKEFEDGEYRDTNSILPMFQKGDTIIQAGEYWFQKNFSAKVVKHHPIIIQNGKIIANVVTVKNSDGTLKLNHTNDVKNTSIVRRNVNPISSQAPMFMPGDSTIVLNEPVLDFVATMYRGNLELEDVLPINSNIRNAALKRQWPLPQAELQQGDYTGTRYDIYKDPELYTNEFQQQMQDFISKLSVGMEIKHPNLITDNLEPSIDTNKLESDSSGIYLSKLKKLIPGLGINFHIMDVLVEDENGKKVSVAQKGNKAELFQYENATNNKKQETDRKIKGMNRISIKMGRLIGDGTVDDKGPFLESSVIPPPAGLEWDDFFSENDVEGSGITPFRLKNPADSALPPNWNYLTITEFLPVYGAMIDRIIEITDVARGWIETTTGIIDEALKFIEDFINFLNQTNQSILTALTILTEGLNATGLYTLSLSGFGGVKEFTEKLSNAKFIVDRINPYSSMEIETVDVQSTVVNPITGLEETVTTKTLKPVLTPADKAGSQGKIYSASELSNLKYTLAIVFYAQGTDSKAFNKFQDNFKLAQDFSTDFARSITEGTILESLVEQLVGEGDSRSIAEKIKPYVYDIQVSNSDGVYVSAEHAVISPDNLKIRVIFANDAHLFTEEEKTLINNIQGRTINMSPAIISSGLNLSQEDVDAGKAEFTLTQNGRNFLLRNPPSVSSTFDSNGREFYILDFTPVDTLTASEPGDPNYIFTAIKNPVYSVEKMKITSEYGMTLKAGFRISQTTVVDVEIN